MTQPSEKAMTLPPRIAKALYYLDDAASFAALEASIVEAMSAVEHERDEANNWCDAAIERAEQAEAWLARLREAAQFKHNILIYEDADGPDMGQRVRVVGTWVAIPREDFDALRAALASEAPSPQGKP